MSKRERFIAAMAFSVMMLCWSPQVVWAQKELDRPVSVSVRHGNVSTVLAAIRKATGMDILYSGDVLKTWPKVTIDAKGQSARALLDELMSQTGCEYKVNGKIIAISKKQTSRKRHVSGVVTDEQGEPVIGVPVSLADGKVLGVTDGDGRYSIEVPSTVMELKLSYVGMKPQTVRLAAGASAVQRDITMLSDNQLADVIVTGYQKLKREDVTGAYQIISAKDMDLRYTGDVTSNLEGKVPGLIKYNNGVTDQLAIRGTSSLSASTKPLVVVNGLPIQGSLEDLNPNDIESITVLKDASAAAIYGARASNGVIVVVTKKATQEKLQVSFNADLTIKQKQSYSNRNWMNAAEFLELSQANLDAIAADDYEWGSMKDYFDVHPTGYSSFTRFYMGHKAGTVSDEEYNNTIAQWSKNNYRDQWRKLMLRNEVIQQYNLSMRTKGKYLNSNISVNFKNDNLGTTKVYSRSLLFNYEGILNMTKWADLRLGLFVAADRSKTRLDYFGLQNIDSKDVYESMWNADGTPATLRGRVPLDEPALLDTSLDLKSENYVLQEEMNKNFSKTRAHLLRPFLHLEVRPVDGLTISGQFQYEDSYTKTEDQYLADSYDMRHLYNLYTYKGKHYLPEGGLLESSTAEGHHYTLRMQASYNKTFAEKHAVSALIGYEYRQQKSRTVSGQLVGYDDLTQTNTTQLTNLYDAYKLEHSDLGQYFSPVGFRLGGGSTSDILHRFYSVYGTANYTYDHRYATNFSYRVDKADLFGSDPKFRGRPLWSVGLSWNVNNEAFMRDIKWIDALKLRASYGTTGNINSSVSSYLTARILTEDLYGGKRATLNTPPNDQLRCEKTQNWNIGADFSVLGHRLRGSLDYYLKNGSDILSTTDIDPTSGWSSLTINNAKIRNQGVELQLDGTILPAKSRDYLGINASLNLAYNNNKVTAINHDITSGYEALGSDTYHKGKPVHSLYSMRYGGIAIDDNGNQQVYFIKADGTKVAAATFDNELETADVIYNGSLDPKLSTSLTAELTWKGFSLSGLFVFYGGHYMRTHAEQWTIVKGTEYQGNIDRSLLNYWRSDDKTAFLANGFAARNMIMFNDDPAQTNITVEHADFLKLRSLVLGYNFSREICQKLRISNLRLRLQMNNVFCWARNHDSLDPEEVDPYSGYALPKIPKSYVMSLAVDF